MSTKKVVAHAFLDPARPFDRYHHYYARAKLATDPVYRGVLQALQGCEAPLLDVGCGIGLLLHAMRAAGRDLAYLGVDLDPRKIDTARDAMARAQLAGASFECGDAAAGLPPHAGSVAILDVMQFLPDHAAREALLAAAIARVRADGRLVIRTGLADGSTRAGITRVVDRLSNLWGWMRTGPDRYPEREWLQQRLADAGFLVRFSPLSGNTPFNNWLVVAQRNT